MSQKPGIVQALNGLGIYYYRMGIYGEATRYLLSSAALAQSINTPKQSMISYETLSSLYEKTGQIDKAYHYYKLYAAARDSLFNSIESDKIAESSMKLETMKKEREMESLKQAKTMADLTLGKKHNQLNLLVLGIVSLCIIIFILYWYIRNTKKNQYAVERKNLELEQLNSELQTHIGEIRTLSGLLPICSSCKKIRNDRGYWEQLEGYVSQHSGATFSHGICPECMAELYPAYMKQKKVP
ncbi:MAG: hypothetical protein NTV54_17100 [Ignavibacteriales bacterium]|nr:hypothetical protein [Ignavibacteriales bacterium]